MSERAMNRHLDQDELERFVPRLRAEGAAEPSVELRAHVEDCGRCRRELATLRRLDEALASLPEHRPSTDFVESVMARVRLPVPWYRQVWATLVERWVLVIGCVAGLGASAGVTTWWIASNPDVSFGGLSSFALERVSALFWSMVVGLGQRLWASGLPGTLRALVDSVEPVEAVLVMTVLSLCAVSAGAVMARLMRASPPRVAASR